MCPALNKLIAPRNQRRAGRPARHDAALRPGCVRRTAEAGAALLPRGDSPTRSPRTNSLCTVSALSIYLSSNDNRHADCGERLTSLANGSAACANIHTMRSPSPSPSPQPLALRQRCVDSAELNAETVYVCFASICSSRRGGLDVYAFRPLPARDNV